jgi:ABC-type cobalamin/Fe3+-siderophores transport system ATPase subunit
MLSLREIRDRDQLTVICNLHTLDTARTYCDRVIGMHKGRIVFDDEPSKLTPEVVRDVYGAESGVGRIRDLHRDHQIGTGIGSRESPNGIVTIHLQNRTSFYVWSSDDPSFSRESYLSINFAISN